MHWLLAAFDSYLITWNGVSARANRMNKITWPNTCGKREKSWRTYCSSKLFWYVVLMLLVVVMYLLVVVLSLLLFLLLLLFFVGSIVDGLVLNLFLVLYLLVMVLSLLLFLLLLLLFVGSGVVIWWCCICWWCCCYCYYCCCDCCWMYRCCCCVCSLACLCILCLEVCLCSVFLSLEYKQNLKEPNFTEVSDKVSFFLRYYKLHFIAFHSPTQHKLTCLLLKLKKH